VLQYFNLWPYLSWGCYKTYAEVKSVCGRTIYNVCRYQLLQPYLNVWL